MKAFKVNRNQQDYYRVDLPPRLFLDGKRRSVMAKTRREALEKAEALIAKRKKGLNTDCAKATVAEFLTRFLDYYQTEGGVALRTWQDYRYHIETNIVPAIGPLPLGDLKPLQVDEWLRGLRERELGDRTIDYAHSVLRRALQFAVEWEILDRNPAGARFRAAKCKRTVKPGGKKIRFLDPDETRRFLEATKGGAHEALYALAITTGMRPEEVSGLRWRDIDLDNRKLTINQVISKTRRKKATPAPVSNSARPRPKRADARSTFRRSSPSCLASTGARSTSCDASPATAGRITDSFFRHKSARHLKSATSCGSFRRSAKASACRDCASMICATPTRRC